LLSTTLVSGAVQSGASSSLQPPQNFQTIQNPTQTMQGTASGICDLNSPILRIGSSGPKVQELQRYLTQLGYGYLFERDGIDGKFGPATQNAVNTFQQENGLDLVDGIVGPRTWDVLCDSVTLIQQHQPPIQQQQQQQNQESAVKQIPSGQTKPFTIKMEFFSDTQDMEEVH